MRRGVYVVGRPELSREGEWMAALLACGPRSVLSHITAAALWGIATESRVESRTVHITGPRTSRRAQSGVKYHQRTISPSEATLQHSLPLTPPSLTLVDLAATFPPRRLEAAVNAADRLELITPQRLREELTAMPPRHGLPALRQLLDRRTFQITDSDLERRFLALVRAAKLPAPLTRQSVSGFRVDFFWPDLGLVVETDGLRYHRTPSQQAGDRLRDQAHAAAGLTPLRFTHDQIRHEPNQVAHALARVIARLAA